MKTKLGVLSVAVISTLTLTACPGSGGSSNSTPVGVNPPGAVGALNAGSCNIQSNFYTCTQTLNGVLYTTPSNSYLSQPDLCAKLNDNYSFANKDARGQVVAAEWRLDYSRRMCQTVGQPTYPTQPVVGMKTFTCQLSAKKGDMTYDGQPQQIQLSPYLNKQSIPAVALRTTGRGFFRISRWVKFAQLNVEYFPRLSADINSTDLIKMSVVDIDEDISASVTGVTNAENRIEIRPQDTEGEQTTLIATCSSAENKAMPPAMAANGYKCVGSETAQGKTTEINFVNQLSDVVESGISITNNVFVQGDQASAVSFTQTSTVHDDSMINLKSKLNSATSIAIKKSGYSLNVKCQPK